MKKRTRKKKMIKKNIMTDVGGVSNVQRKF